MARLNRLIYIAAALFCGASVCLAQNTEPVGPAGWTVRNWMGFSAQIAVFVLAVWAVYRLANWNK